MSALPPIQRPTNAAPLHRVHAPTDDRPKDREKPPERQDRRDSVVDETTPESEDHLDVRV